MYTVRDLLSQIYNATTNAIYVQLVAGTAAIGKLAANSGVDIGDVDVTSISAGANHIGNVGGEDIVITEQLVVTAGAYSAGDVVGAKIVLENAARATGLGGIIKSVVIIDDNGQDDEKVADRCPYREGPDERGGPEDGPVHAERGRRPDRGYTNREGLRL